MYSQYSMPNIKKYFTAEAKKAAQKLIQKKAQAKYRKTEKGKLTRAKAYKKWAQSKKGKEFQKKNYDKHKDKMYERSRRWQLKNKDKVNSYKAKYRSSEQFKITHKNYEQSERGKEVKKKYYQTKGKETKKRYLKTDSGRLSLIKTRNKPEFKEYHRKYQKTEKYLNKLKERVNKRYKSDVTFKLRKLMVSSVKQFLK